ncbi:MAG: hypothetical protein Q7K65_02450 [Candidatus Buchananbacteria bacterium]|nr:hypothetical protein [Candidatus Buchananbacteria bacterium]
MVLSGLQKYILKKGLEGEKNTVNKAVLKRFYVGQKISPSEEDKLNIITKSVDKLIKRGLIRGVGIKTAKKWFIKEVVLTKEGTKKAKELLGRQQKLPFKKYKDKK